MIAVIQRVTQASVDAPEADHKASIGPGLCVLLGVAADDAPGHADWMADKIARLRVFRDEQGRMNRSVLDIAGGVLLVSQFTLLGDCSQGHRPSFTAAAPPEVARPLYERVASRLRENHRLVVGTGIFGAMMQVHIINDGPVTIILRSSGRP